MPADSDAAWMIAVAAVGGGDGHIVRLRIALDLQLTVGIVETHDLLKTTADVHLQNDLNDSDEGLESNCVNWIYF